MKRWLPLLLTRLLVLFWCLLLLWSCQPAFAQQPDTRPHASNLRFNKLRAGNLGNCGSNNFVTGFNAQTGAQVCVQPSSSMLSDATDLVKRVTPQKVSNKQNVPREVTMVPTGGAITPPCDDADVIVVNGLAGNLTVNDPAPCTGTNPEPSQEITFRFFSSATRQIFWGGAYSIEAGVPLLNSTTGDNATYDYIKYIRNSVTSKFDAVAVRASGKGVTTLASSATFTCPGDNSTQCQMSHTGAAGTLTVAVPSGSPVDGQMLLLLFACQNAQTFAFNAIFRASPNVALPTTCPADLTKLTAVGVRYSTLVSGGPVWQVLGVN